MTIREIWSKTANWLGGGRRDGFEPDVADDGLISPEAEELDIEDQQLTQDINAESVIMVKKPDETEKTRSTEQLQGGFNQLIEKLEGINQNLNKHTSQQESLISRINELPEFFENFPEMLNNQKAAIEVVMEQLKMNASKNEQILSVMSKIPEETSKQTDAMVNINHQLSASADIDAQMAEGFSRFNHSVEKLNTNAESQNDSILQMSKTFATSDRYMKYLMTHQNKRFMWLYVISISICALAILILAGVIVFIAK